MTEYGFMLDEMTRILPLLRAEDSHALLKQEIENNEHLLIATKTTRSRAVPEFKRRYNAVSHDFWEKFLNLPPR